MIRRKRIIASLAIAGLTAWGLWLAPLERPRAHVSDADAHTFSFWFSPDSRLFATKDYGPDKRTRLRVFGVVDGQLVALLYQGQEQFVYLLFSPDGQEIAGITNTGGVVTWETATGRQRMRTDSPVDSNKDSYALMSYAPSGALLVQDVKALEQIPPVLRLLDAATNRQTFAVPLPDLGRDFHLSQHPKALPHHAAFINDSHHQCLFDLATGRKRAEWRVPFKYNWMEFSADGNMAAVTRGDTITEIFVAVSPTSDWNHLPALNNTFNINLSPSGEYLAGHMSTATENKTWYTRWLPTLSPRVRVVRVSDGAIVAQFRGGGDSKFSPDGRTLAVFLNDEHQVQLWDFPPRRLWGWIVGGAAGAGMAMYFCTTWRTRRRTPSPTVSQPQRGAMR